MRAVFILLFSFSTLICFSQNISKAKAISIAKANGNVRQIKTAELKTDSATQIICWVLEEKINVQKEQRKFIKSKQAGMKTFVADRIKVDAQTGKIISREYITLGSCHKSPIF